MLGFDPYDIKNPEQLRLQHRWQQRFSRYLGYLLDGSLLAGKLKLADLASVVGGLGLEGDQVSFAVDHSLNRRLPANGVVLFPVGCSSNP